MQQTERVVPRKHKDMLRNGPGRLDQNAYPLVLKWRSGATET